MVQPSRDVERHIRLPARYQLSGKQGCPHSQGRSLIHPLIGGIIPLGAEIEGRRIDPLISAAEALYRLNIFRGVKGEDLLLLSLPWGQQQR